MAQRNQDALQDWFARQRQERMQEVQQMTSRRADSASSASSSASNINTVRELMENRLGKTVNDSTQQTRQPEMQQAVLVEVRGLFETRPVTNMLRSPHFRRDLENIVRASISAAQESRSRAESTQSSLSSLSIPPPPPPPASSVRPSSPLQAAPRRSQHQAPQNGRNVSNPPNRPQQQVEVPPPPPPPEVHNAATLADRLHQEQLVVDISELLHTRLVSSTLNSNFRDQLEHLMQSNFVHPDRAHRSVQALSQLPPSNHIRNDFSHLGIHTPGIGLAEHDWDSDSVSIISATAHRVPMSQTSVGMAREMAGMRNEMSQMRNMLKMVLDMQSDLQRAVRQEVSAAMAASSPLGQTIPNPAPSRPTQAAGKCAICLSAKADTLAYRCGHLCMCNTCALNLGQHQTRQKTCPVCRAPIQDLVRVYVCDQ